MEKQSLQFDEATLTPDDIVDTQDCIQKRVLRLLCRRGFFSKEEVEKMLSYDQSGFSLDAKVRIESWDKDGLERLIRYCARPPFASENFRWNGCLLSYRFSKPSHTGQNTRKTMQKDKTKALLVVQFKPFSTFSPLPPTEKKRRKA